MEFQHIREGRGGFPELLYTVKTIAMCRTANGVQTELQTELQTDKVAPKSGGSFFIIGGRG